MRKENNVTDRIAVSQKHGQTVDANSQSTGGRHPILQCCHKIFIHHVGLAVPRLPLRYLTQETFLLIDRIIQFGKTIGNFSAENKAFKTIRKLRMIFSSF